MAFPPHYYYSGHYNLSCESPEFSTPPTTGHGCVCGLTMQCEESVPSFDKGTWPNMVQSESCITSSLSSYMSFPERLGVSDMAVPALPEFNLGSGYVLAGNQHVACEFGDECNGLVSNLWRDCHASSDNLEIQDKPVQEIVEEGSMKIGRYSVEERKDKILKYLKKRNQRNFNKTIKYACRKTLADKRIRVRGRFAKNNELHEGNPLTKNNDTQKEEEIFYNDDVQIKHDEEDWLQEAMASFMYLPYISGPML